MTRLKDLAIGLSLTLASMLLLLLGLEVFLRLTIEKQADALYADLSYSRSRDDEYFQRSFLALYPEGKDWRQGVYDPYLGWDYVEDGRVRGPKVYSLQPEDGIFRIVAIGDSFVYGSLVAHHQTYSSYLESLLDSSEVLNMGVAGYGIDQAVLKYLKYGSQYEPDLVIFGTFPHDYVRTGLSFYGYSKPVFEYDDENGAVELTNTNIPPPDEVIVELERKLGSPILYSYAFLKNKLTRAYWKLVGSDAKERYYQEMDVIVEHVLAMLVESTKATGTKLLIVEAPNGTNFRDEKSLLAAKREDNHTHLLNLYEKLGIPYIDLLEEFISGYSKDEVYNNLYQPLDVPGTRSTRAHFTAKGNLEVAKIIKKKLEALQWVTPDRTDSKG